MAAGVIAWHALGAAVGGGVDLTHGCYVGRHSLSSRLPGLAKCRDWYDYPAAAIRQ